MGRVFARTAMFSATAARMSAFNASFIDRVALMEVDGAPGIAFEAGIEEARRVLQRRTLGEGHLHDASCTSRRCR